MTENMEPSASNAELKEEEGERQTLDHFVELAEVLRMIETVPSTEEPEFERTYEQYQEILSRYQEQPHLLDPHMEVLLTRLLSRVRKAVAVEESVHAAFKYIYTLSKVRTYKGLVNFLPHDLSDLDFALTLLEAQDIQEFRYWETRYVLLLWLSILVLNPFHMARLDASNVPPKKTKMARIYKVCRRYSEVNDTCSGIAAYLTGKYLIRSDVKDAYLTHYFDWVMAQHRSDTVAIKYGQLAAIAAILKHGKRTDLLPHADGLLRWILSCRYNDGADFLKYKAYIKIIQRLGLVYLRPRIAVWRYRRGTRSLTSNLATTGLPGMDSSEGAGGSRDEAEEEHEPVPAAVEEVLEELLQGLRSAGSGVRWSAAKGVGRIAARLTRHCGDEVVGTVIQMLQPLEPHEAWHGACLALAELAKNGLMLPHRLDELVPRLTEALFYDEMKGYMSVGQHIRDAACYMCWAFARAYKSSDLKPFVSEIAGGLLTVAVFDREVNCRRAASAAFQECVGRLGNFPHGIEISTATDFYSVGVRSNAFLRVADFIGQFPDYRHAMITHLVDRKTSHWDVAIRNLAALSLSKQTQREPRYMVSDVLPVLLQRTRTIDVNVRHGAVVALGEIVGALRMLEQQYLLGSDILLTPSLIEELNELMSYFWTRDMFKGISGELMRLACMDFVRNCSRGKLAAKPDCVAIWQRVINQCLVSQTPAVREAAVGAFYELSRVYYGDKDTEDKEIRQANKELLETLIEGVRNSSDEHSRCGYLAALGALPAHVIGSNLERLVQTLIGQSLTPLTLVDIPELMAKYEEDGDDSMFPTQKWSEARRDAVRALAAVVQTVGFGKKLLNETDTFRDPLLFDDVVNCFLMALDEYTLDNRGDIGAWVREAAMTALFDTLTVCPVEILQREHVRRTMLGLAQQAVEKIDRTRGLAGRLFCRFLHSKPLLPFIDDDIRLRAIFPEDADSVLWLFADHTFPLFCELLDIPAYSKRVLLGLSASVGQLTESLIKHASAAFFDFLRSHPQQVRRICDEIVENFNENVRKERVVYPMLNFLDLLIGSGTINEVLMDESSKFAEEIFRLTNLSIKGHKKLYKLTSSVNVFCQLVQVPAMTRRVLSKMTVFLGLTHVHIRKTTSTRLYEALALHGDLCPFISEANLEEILTILSETDWGLPLVRIRPIRNNLCELMSIRPPVPGSATSIASAASIGDPVEPPKP